MFLQVTLRLSRGIARRWHLDLVRRLGERCGCVPAIVFAGAAERNRPLEARLALEARLFGVRREASLALPDAVLAEAGREDGEPGIVLDFTEDGGEGWRVLFGRAPDALAAGEHRLLELLRDGEAPVAAVVSGAEIRAIGRIGRDRPGLAGAFEDALARVATLIEAALAGAACRALPALGGGGAQAREAGDSGPLAAIVHATAARAYRRLYHAPHWHVGWRHTGAGALLDRARCGEPWQVIEDDGERFYADPFAISTPAGTFLFVEDFAHGSGRGVISAVAFGPQGPLGRPAPVLSRPWHLSYPFVFACDAEYWMVPESCGAGVIELFRATDFPTGWRREATLLEGVEASDATLLEQDGMWWLFATVRDGAGSFSDSLHLWHAPDFRGPWTPHAGNPVLVDAASARPAGRFIREAGYWWRPVQDCRRGYGSALGFARIDRLDPGGYAQSVHAMLRPGPGWPGRRLHTWNEAGGFAFIDGSALARKRWFPRSGSGLGVPAWASAGHEPNITRSE